MFEWTYSGVDFNIPGNGGNNCAEFLPVWQRLLESSFVCVFVAGCIAYAYPRVRLPEKLPVEKSDPCGKRILLVSMCLTFGIEMGYKVSTRQVIYILNPCHISTMIQIYILAAPPSRMVTAMFRTNLHMLVGAPIAILFPVINTRTLPFEVEVYFIQHILMMIVPYYLLKLGGVYTPEKLSDMSWAFLSLGWLYFAYFVPVSYIAFTSHVNLNNMLCPAISDPFYGRLYRIIAMGHQFICLPLGGKFVAATAQYFSIAPPSDIKETLIFVSESTQSNTDTATEIGSGDASTLNSKILTDSINAHKVHNRNGTENGFKSQISDKNGILNKEGHESGPKTAHTVGNGHLKEA